MWWYLHFLVRLDTKLSSHSARSYQDTSITNYWWPRSKIRSTNKLKISYKYYCTAQVWLILHALPMVTLYAMALPFLAFISNSLWFNFELLTLPNILAKLSPPFPCYKCHLSWSWCTPPQTSCTPPGPWSLLPPYNTLYT